MAEAGTENWHIATTPIRSGIVAAFKKRKFSHSRVPSLTSDKSHPSSPLRRFVKRLRKKNSNKTTHVEDVVASSKYERADWVLSRFLYKKGSWSDTTTMVSGANTRQNSGSVGYAGLSVTGSEAPLEPSFTHAIPFRPRNTEPVRNGHSWVSTVHELPDSGIFELPGETLSAGSS